MEFDLIVIGSGPGGYVPAIKAAQCGMKTAIIESRELGGTCLNRGCIPTKTLLHASNLVDSINDAELFGVNISGFSTDVNSFFMRKDNIVNGIRDGLERLIKSSGVTIIKGTASIASKGVVDVFQDNETKRLTGKNILIASGAKAAMPPIPGIDSEGVTSSDALLKEPNSFRSLIIIGGGVIGVEIASVFSSFGTEVTVLEGLERILPTMDREISQNLTMIFKKRNISVVTGALVKNISPDGNMLRCSYESKNETHSTTAEHILIATGRIPSFDRLFVPSLGIETKRGIVVDSDFMTSVDGIYAVGDVVDGGTQLAHVASAQGINAVSHMLGSSYKVDLSVIPACIYTRPEIASCGITLEAAKELGIQAKSKKYLMGGNARSLIENADRGFIKIIIREQDNVLIGAHLMCERATDIIGELSLAISKGMTADDISSVIHAHPTFYEGVYEAATGL